MIPIKISARVRGRAQMLAQMLLLTALIAPTALAKGGSTGAAIEQGDSTTRQEKIEFSQKAIVEMEAAAETVSSSLDAAERAKDTVKISCLTKALSSIRSMAEVSGLLLEEMEAANRSGEAAVIALADTKLRAVATALSRVRKELATAKNCDEADSTPGVTDLNVNIDGLTDDQDTLPLDEGESPGGYPAPPDASQFQ